MGRLRAGQVEWCARKFAVALPPQRDIGMSPVDTQDKRS